MPMLMTNPWRNTELMTLCFSCECASETNGGIANENPSANTKIEKNTAFPRETDARACAPRSLPTIILSNKLTETWPTCVIITGSASVRHALVYCLLRNFIKKICSKNTANFLVYLLNVIISLQNSQHPLPKPDLSLR